MSDTRVYPVGSSFPKSRYIKDTNGVPTFVEFGVTKTQRTRVTTAQVNAGFTLLPALPGVKWRLVDATLIAIGGNAATATSVDLIGTKAGSASRPLVAAIAALTRSTVARMGASNMVVLADGASLTAHDNNSAITIGTQSGGSGLATATHIDAILTYVAEAAA